MCVPFAQIFLEHSDGEIPAKIIKIIEQKFSEENTEPTKEQADKILELKQKTEMVLQKKKETTLVNEAIKKLPRAPQRIPRKLAQSEVSHFDKNRRII